MVNKIPIGDFEFWVGIFRIGDWGFRIGEKLIWAKHESSI
jgi:hypothetical protein